jgi:hypothetical protein
MHALRTSYVYTPQLVIDGKVHVVGSDRAAVEAAIEKAKASPGPHLRIGLDEERDGRMHVSIPAATLEGPASVMLVAFDRKHLTEVSAGENLGREITNYRVVRGLSMIGSYDGKATEIVIDEASALPGVTADGCAVILQSEKSGAILGAGIAWTKPGGS